MIRSTLDLRKPHRAVIYARYSDANQNPRSIDQQIDTINREIKRQGLPWTVDKTYQDAAISGRKTRKRPGFQQMWRDLRDNVVQAQLIIVDTFERLSRADNNLELRNKLQQAGYIVVTADSRFADPTSAAGEALSFVESIRAKDVSRSKAHDVLRGKIDSVRQKYWPGGPTPFGFRLKTIFGFIRGVEEVHHRELEVDPTTEWIVKHIFQLADEQGLGICRIAKALNADERISSSSKPFNDSTVGRMLDNEIYAGVMNWNKHCTGIVNDTRILQANPQSEWERIEDFCPSIVSQEQWKRVREVRAERGARIKRSRNSKPNVAKRAISHATGLALKYPLSGLVRCAHCDRSMVAGSSNYRPKSGKARRYVYYHCPAASYDACSNHRTVPEEWLRQTVVDLILRRVFFIDRAWKDDSVPERFGLAHQSIDAATFGENSALQELLIHVQSELNLRAANRPERRHILEVEQRENQEQQQSYLVSLGKSSLPPAVRDVVETQLAGVMARLAEIGHELKSDAVQQERISRIATLETVIQNLQHLSEILAANNVSATNLCLAQHIDTISCNSEGRVVVRTCKLGALAEVRDLLGNDAMATNEAMTADRPPHSVGSPRRRSRRDTGAAFDEEDDANTANEFGTDPHRFGGLSLEWFWHDEFAIPVKLSWSKAHAIEVAQSRLEKPCGLETLAKRFGMSKPTIDTALKYAKEQGVDATQIDARYLQPNWAKCHAEEVAEYFRQPNANMAEAMKRFQKSDAWIRRARKIAEERSTTQLTIVPLPQSDRPNGVDDISADDAA